MIGAANVRCLSNDDTEAWSARMAGMCVCDLDVTPGVEPVEGGSLDH